MKYRPHLFGATLAESMEHAIDVDDMIGLANFLEKDLKRWGYKLEHHDLKLGDWILDERNGWQTALVLLKNKEIEAGKWFFNMEPDYFGVIGYVGL